SSTTTVTREPPSGSPAPATSPTARPWTSKKPPNARTVSIKAPWESPCWLRTSPIRKRRPCRFSKRRVGASSPYGSERGRASPSGEKLPPSGGTVFRVGKWFSRVGESWSRVGRPFFERENGFPGGGEPLPTGEKSSPTGEALPP